PDLRPLPTRRSPDLPAYPTPPSRRRSSRSSWWVSRTVRRRYQPVMRPPMRHQALAASAALVLGLSGCTGELGGNVPGSTPGPGPTTPGPGGSPSDGSPPPVGTTCDPSAPVPPAPMRRLTAAQWSATIAALFDGRVD